MTPPTPRPSVTVLTPHGMETIPVHLGDPEYPALFRFDKYEQSVLVGGAILFTHSKDDCTQDYCTIHNHSHHHMRSWFQRWNFLDAYMERICPHGSTHPDPDELEHKKPKVHACDGCCDPASQFKDDYQELISNYNNKKGRAR